ncbi:MAG: ABC transporter permease [Bacteroidota bacterium]|nr:ABC transporter permease [Bacteroidota bacterium]
MRTWWSLYQEYFRRMPIAFGSLHVFLIVFLFTGFIVSEKPVFCIYKGTIHSFIFNQKLPKGSELEKDFYLEAEQNWQNLTFDFVVWPLVVKDPYHLDQYNSWKRPFSYDSSQQVFFLAGTYELGKDVGVHLLYGFRKSMLIGFLSMLFATILGLLLGISATVNSTGKFRMNRMQKGLIWISILVSIYMLMTGIELREVKILWVLLVLLIGIILLYRLAFKKRETTTEFNVDFIVLRWIESVKSIPFLMVILLLIQWVERPGPMFISYLIALYYSAVLAQYARISATKWRNQAFIQAAHSLGLSERRIMFRHILPFVVKDLIPLIVFGMASAILLESSISFLGLGLPVDEISLGNMMQSGRNNLSAWWVMLFPGFLIFWIVWVFQSLGNELSKVPEEKEYPLIL